MIGIAPKNKSAFVNMLNRIGFLVLFIIIYYTFWFYLIAIIKFKNKN